MEDNCKKHGPSDGSNWFHDARGIPLARVCDKCRGEKLATYRPEIISDPNYDSVEPIEPEPDDYVAPREFSVDGLHEDAIRDMFPQGPVVREGDDNE